MNSERGDMTCTEGTMSGPYKPTRLPRIDRRLHNMQLNSGSVTAQCHACNVHTCLTPHAVAIDINECP